MTIFANFKQLLSRYLLDFLTKAKEVRKNADKNQENSDRRLRLVQMQKQRVQQEWNRP